MGLPLVDKVDSRHRKGAQRRRGNGGLLFQRHEGQRKAQDFSTAGEEHLRRDAIQAKKQEFFQSQAFSNACHEGIEGLSKDHVETLPRSTRARCNGSFWRGFQRKNATSWRHLKVLGIHRRPK